MSLPFLPSNRRPICSRHPAVSGRSFHRSVTLGLALGLSVGGAWSARAVNDAFSTTPTIGLNSLYNFTGNFTTGTTTPGAATGTPASGDSLYFGTSSATTLNNDLSGDSFAGLTFNAGASAFTIGGNAFTLTGAITNNGTSLETINNAITLGANESINSAAGAITLGGTISGSFVLSVTGPNAVTLGGTGNTFSGLVLGVGQTANANTNVALVNGVQATVNLNSTQSVGALTVGEGAGTLNIAAGAAITSTTLGQANSNDRFVGLNVNLGAGASLITNATNTAGVLVVGSQFNVLTLNGTDFAANSTNAAGGTVVAATYTASTATTLSGNANVVTDVAPVGNSSATTLRFADTTGHTITIGAANNLSLNGEGAVLMSANSGAVVNTITGGTLYGTSNRGYSFTNFDTTSGSGLVVNSNLINAPISGSGTAATTSVLVAGGGKVTFGGANVINGPLMIAGAGTTLSVGSDANLGGFNGTVSVTAATNGSPTVTLAAATSTLGSLVVGDVLLGQTISNISGTTVTLGGNYTGTSIATATTVGYAGGGSVNLNGGTLAVTGTFSLSETGTQAADTANGVTDVRNRNIGLGVSGGTIDVSSGNTLTVPGIISGGALTKTDTGTLLLTNGNTYAGTTTISGGMLTVAAFAGITGSPAINIGTNGTFDTSAKGATGFTVLTTQTVTNNGTVNGGFTVQGTLAGVGTISGVTAISTGGTITGAGRGTVGALTLTNTLTINSGGIYLADVLSGTGSDLLKLTGTGAAGVLTLASGSILTVSGTVDGTSTYALANYASETGTFTTATLPSGYSLSYGGTELDLVPTAVPEPTTILGGLLTLVALGWRQRRLSARSGGQAA